MLDLVVGLGACHRVIVLGQNVQLESLVGEVRSFLPIECHGDIAIDINRIEQMGLDQNLHLRDLRHVVALASETRCVVLIIIGFAIVCVFIIGIRIIRGKFIVQETLEHLFKIVITLLVVELQ